MVLDFEKYAVKGNEFIRLVALELEVPRDKAGRVVRAVLHALRNRITLSESLQLLAQLPMAIKAVFVDGWSYHAERKRVHRWQDFLDEIRTEDKNLSGYDFGNDDQALRAVQAVFFALREYVSEGEMRQVLEVLPQAIQEMLQAPTPVKSNGGTALK